MSHDSVICDAGDIARGRFSKYLARKSSGVRLWTRKDAWSGLLVPELSVNFADGGSLRVTFWQQKDAIALADMFVHAKPAASKPPAYPDHCRHPEQCAGKGYCPRDISCVD